MLCLQLRWLLSPVLLNALESVLLFWQQQLAISKEDVIISRLWNLLAPDEGVQNAFFWTSLVKNDFWFVQRAQVPGGTAYR